MNLTAQEPHLPCGEGRLRGIGHDGRVLSRWRGVSGNLQARLRVAFQRPFTMLSSSHTRTQVRLSFCWKWWSFVGTQGPPAALEWKD